MSTSVDPAEAGAKRPGGKSRAERHAYAARVKFWRVFIVTTFFVVVLGGNLLVGAVVLLESLRTQARADKTAAPSISAHIRRPLLDGTFCRNTVIDNNTSNTVTDKIERYDGRDGRTFFGGRSEFTWGR